MKNKIKNNQQAFTEFHESMRLQQKNLKQGLEKFVRKSAQEAEGISIVKDKVVLHGIEKKLEE